MQEDWSFDLEGQLFLFTYLSQKNEVFLIPENHRASKEQFLLQVQDSRNCSKNQKKERRKGHLNRKL